MRKAFIILTGIIFTLLFSACKQFTADIDDYLGYWSSEAFILSSEIDKETHNDRSGMASVASADDVTVTLKVRNPRSFRFVMPSPSETRNIVEFAHFSGTKPIANNQYEMKQLSADTLQLVYKDSFLKNSEWGEKDISSTITLYADDGRVFKQTFTVPLKANTRPPKPRYVVAKTKGETAYYVLCITVPDMDKKLQGDQRLHKDIKHIRINETEYTFSVNTAQTAFTKPDNEVFIMHDDIEKLGGSNADDVPTDSSWVLYYQTNVKVEVGTAKKDYTIRLVDEKGLVSEKLDASTNPNKPKIEEPAIAKGRKISGSGSEADPVRIGTDSSGAELSLSSAPAHTKVHCTLTEIGSTDSPTSYKGNPVTVPLPLNGAGEKNYKLEYYADGTGFEATAKKTVYYKILQEYKVTFSVAGGEGELKGDYNDGSFHSAATQNGGAEAKLEKVPHGTFVTFTATPNTSNGYEVDSWEVSPGRFESGGGTGTSAALKVTGDKTVKVKFKKKGVTVTYSVDGGQGGQIQAGSDSPTTSGRTSVTHGGSITFTAYPNEAHGYEVEKWMVDGNEVTGYKSTKYTLSGITGDKTVTVKFKKKVYNVTFSVAGGQGRLAGKRGDTNKEQTVRNGESAITFADVPYGSTMSFTATADEGWEVEGWRVLSGNFATGGGSGAANATATLTVDGHKTVTVKFKPGELHFNSGGPDAWKRLREEAAKTEGSHTIVINGEITSPDGNNEITLGRDLTIQGKDSSAVLNANGITRIFRVENDKTLILKDITLKNAQVGSTNKGGGVYIENGGTLIMQGSTTITNCKAGDGGGVYVDGTFKMEGRALVTPESNTDNEVYLESGKTVTVTGALTHTPAAKIRVADYQKNRVLAVGEHAKKENFQLAPVGGKNWRYKKVGDEIKFVTGKLTYTIEKIISIEEHDNGNGSDAEYYWTMQINGKNVSKRTHHDSWKPETKETKKKGKVPELEINGHQTVLFNYTDKETVGAYFWIREEDHGLGDDDTVADVTKDITYENDQLKFEGKTISFGQEKSFRLEFRSNEGDVDVVCRIGWEDE